MNSPEDMNAEEAVTLNEEFRRLDIGELDNLDRDDFVLVGLYVQVYNFMDFNIQRLYAFLSSTPSFQKPSISGKLSIHRMIDAIKDGCAPYMEDDMLKAFQADLEEIKRCRPQRNLLAHFAAKRLPHRDAIVLLNANPADYRNNIKKPGAVSYTVQELSDLRNLIDHMQIYERRLATTCSALIDRIVRQREALE